MKHRRVTGGGGFERQYYEGGRWYRYVRVDGKYVLEHRHIMATHLATQGKVLLPSDLVIHIDDDTLNNELGNLKVVQRLGEKKAGVWVKMICANPNCPHPDFERRESQIRSNISYCSRECYDLVRCKNAQPKSKKTTGSTN